MKCLMSEEFHEKSNVYVTQNFIELLKLNTVFDLETRNIIEYITSSIPELKNRQKIFGDLMNHQELEEQITKLFDTLNLIYQMNDERTEKPANIFRSFVVLCDLPKALQSVNEEIGKVQVQLKSDSFIHLVKFIDTILDELLSYDTMEKVRNAVDFPKSVTYKIGLDNELKIKDVGLCRIHSQSFTNNSKKDRIIKWNDVASQKYRANSFFSKRVDVEDDFPGPIELLLLSEEDPKLLFTDEPKSIANDIQNILIEALSQILQTQTDSAFSKIRSFRIFVKEKLNVLYTELEFLVNGLKIINCLKKGGLATCFPQLVPAKDKKLFVQDAYHPSLACTRAAIQNPVNFDEWGDIILLSGVNTGGKTTYLQTIGSIQLLAQLGLPIPGKDAVISVVDSIVLAFSVSEDDEDCQGKFHQELTILKEALSHIGPHSFFLFNEPLTGSSPIVCTHLMNEILSVLKVLNSRGIWVSHLTSPVQKYEEFNASLPGTRVGSIYVSLKNGVPDYTIHVGLPPQNQYATQLFTSESSKK